MTAILILDDSPEDIEQCAQLLENAMPQVVVKSSTNGADALSQVHVTTFDCVLLDLRLDGEDGLDVLRNLQKLRPKLPVIVLTGQGNENAATNAFVAGAAYYLPKRELTAKALGTAVLRVIEKAANDRELIAKREAVERANRLEAVGQLAAGIAHDFNNQLGALRFSMHLMTEAESREAIDSQLQTASKIISESTSLASRLLSLTRQGDLTAKEVSVTETLSNLQALATVSVSDRASLDVQLPEATLWVHCDPGQLLNGLLNLVLNADDAIRAKSSAGTISVFATRADDNIRLTVKDNGIGMSQEVLAKCCDPFFTTKAATTGTGLGLAMVHGFARENKGALIIQSTEGMGADMAIVLPASSGQAAAETAAQQVLEQPPVTARVLIVDDQLTLAALTKDVLESEGFVAEIAPNAADALQMIAQGFQPDLVLTDIKMPGMNGFDFAQELRAHDAGIKVIYLTGFAENPDFQHHRPLGPILQKPVAPDDLLDAIKTVLA